MRAADLGLPRRDSGRKKFGFLGLATGTTQQTCQGGVGPFPTEAVGPQWLRAFATPGGAGKSGAFCKEGAGRAIQGRPLMKVKYARHNSAPKALTTTAAGARNDPKATCVRADAPRRMR